MEPTTTFENTNAGLEVCVCELSFEEQLNTFIHFAAAGTICQGVSDGLFSLIKADWTFKELSDISLVLEVAIENDMICLANFIQYFDLVNNPCLEHLWIIAVVDAGQRTFRVASSPKVKKTRKK
jgi:ribosome-associated toxin RatA of RatAB toxin-antitoxin module